MDGSGLRDPHLDRIRALVSPTDRRRLERLEPLLLRHVKAEEDDEVRSAMQLVVESLQPLGDGRRREADAVLIAGRSGSGKTWIVQRMAREFGFGKTDGSGVLFSHKVDSPTSLNELPLQIAAGLGVSIFRQRQNAGYLWDALRDAFHARGVAILHLDEAQHLGDVRPAPDVTKVVSKLKGLLIHDKWPIALVLSGVPETKTLLDADFQFVRRGAFVSYRAINLQEHAKWVWAVMRDLCALVDVDLGIALADGFTPRLIHAANYARGNAIRWIVRGIDESLREAYVGQAPDCGPRHAALDIRHFAQAWRRRLPGSSHTNPFLAEGWIEIDTSRFPTDVP